MRNIEKLQVSVEDLLLGHKRVTTQTSGHVAVLDRHNQITYFNVLGRNGYRSTLNDELINNTLRNNKEEDK